MKNKADRFTGEYHLVQEKYRNFAEAIKGILNQLLADTDIKIYAITARAKDPVKLREKIITKEKEGTKYTALTDIEDLAGVRVVPYLESHKKEIAGLIYTEFEGADPKFEDKSKLKGYRGTHIILSLNPERAKLPEYRRYAGLKCEVQISSALYHTWNEIEHDIVYKPGKDREKLKTLGLDEIEKDFEEIMSSHIDQAAIHFDHIVKKHKDILKAGRIFFSDYLTDIRNATSNEQLLSFLEIADRFSHKRQLDCIKMVEATITLNELEPQVIGAIGPEKIYGKKQEDILKKCGAILGHFQIRYSDTPKVLELLLVLSQSSYQSVSTDAMNALKELVSYNSVFIDQYKTIFPQLNALKFIQQILPKNRAKNFKFILTVLREILSTSTEATFSTKVDELTFRSGALAPNENLIRLRRESIDFVVEILKKTKNLKERLELVRILAAALYPPTSGAGGDELIAMLIEDSKLISKIFQRLIIPKGKVKDYVLALEIEEELNRLLRSKNFDTAEVKHLYDRLQKDPEYNTFCTLVGDIRKYKTPDEDWTVAEKRRAEDVKKLVEKTNKRDLDLWHAQLINYIRPLKEGAIEEWQYSSLKTYIAWLVKEKPVIATELFKKALKTNSNLATNIFVTAFLDALRNAGQVAIWDEFVNEITDRKLPHLLNSLVYSLNLRKEQSLRNIRPKDIELLKKIVRSVKPYDFGRDDDFLLRHALIGSLTRLFVKAPRLMEVLIVEEIDKHPNMAHIYFNELPFASHRGWMNLNSWTPKGKEFMASQLVELKSLDWHNQEMLSEMFEPSLKPILKVIRKRIAKDSKKKRDGMHYEAIPYHFNPDLQRHISTHKDYTNEMGNWLIAMTSTWSKYNRDVAHFIQTIGGASYQVILRELISKGDKKSLKKASYALEGIDEPDFGLCMEITEKTDDKDILDRVSGRMYATGVVSGEDGLARAMEKKAQSLDVYTQSKNKRVRDFAKRMKKHFEENAAREHRDAIERKRRRELDFGS
ncbi:MAG: RelA/SpoT domain-containing protein [Candidatus Paceibacterota bacterium]